LEFWEHVGVRELEQAESEQHEFEVIAFDLLWCVICHWHGLGERGLGKGGSIKKERLLWDG